MLGLCRIVPTSCFTTFHVGVLQNARELDNGTADRPSYLVLFSVSYLASRDMLVQANNRVIERGGVDKQSWVSSETTCAGAITPLSTSSVCLPRCPDCARAGPSTCPFQTPARACRSCSPRRLSSSSTVPDSRGLAVVHITSCASHAFQPSTTPACRARQSHSTSCRLWGGTQATRQTRRRRRQWTTYGAATRPSLARAGPTLMGKALAAQGFTV